MMRVLAFATLLALGCSKGGDPTRTAEAPTAVETLGTPEAPVAADELAKVIQPGTEVVVRGAFLGMNNATIILCGTAKHEVPDKHLPGGKYLAPVAFLCVPRAGQEETFRKAWLLHGKGDGWDTFGKSKTVTVRGRTAEAGPAPYYYYLRDCSLVAVTLPTPTPHQPTSGGEFQFRWDGGSYLGGQGENRPVHCEIAVSQAAFDRLRDGMTLAEAGKIVGLTYAHYKPAGAASELHLVLKKGTGKVTLIFAGTPEARLKSKAAEGLE